MKTPKGYIQGYGAQAVANENQVVLAAEVTSEQNDYEQLHPMIDAMQQNLEAAEVKQKVGTLRRRLRLSQRRQSAGRGGRHPGSAHRGSQRPRPAHREEGSEGAHPEEPVTHETDGAQACDQTRADALPQTRSDDRAGVRAPQDQRMRTLHASRSSRVRQRMEV
jgi:hypothetical protein